MADAGAERGKYAKVANPTTSTRPVSLRWQDTEAQKKSWRAPLIILLALIAGVGLALGHHFLYAHLHGKPLTDERLSQAWALRFGTALAFLVKMSFAMSVGTAFVQHQWLRLRGQGFKIGEVDSLTSVLGNALAFLSSSVWLRHPILALLALISWTIPLSAVITPGSLTVAPVRTLIHGMLDVPKPSFGYSGFGDLGTELVISSSPRIRWLAFSTASSSQPVPIRSVPLNESYSIEFNAPAVKCGPANDSMTRNATLTFGTQYGTADYVYFAAWVPGEEQAIVDQVASKQPSAKVSTIDMSSTDGARLYIMTNIGFNLSRNVTVMVDGQPATYLTVNLTECILYNATYNVDLTFQYPNQDKTVSISNWSNPMSPSDLTHTTSTPQQPLLDYTLMMDAFGQLLVGSSKLSHYGGNTSWLTNWDIINKLDWSRAEAVQAGLEELFQNFTLSLLSDPTFTTNVSVPGTFTSYPQTYVYKPLALLLAYGLGFLATLICATIGLRAFLINNASYQNTFSTFIRATRGHDFDEFTGPEDSGADPLPKKMGRARLDLGERTTERSTVEVT